MQALAAALAVLGGLVIAAQSVSEPLPPGSERYVELRAFRSPYSGAEFFAPVLRSNPPVNDYDYDRCPHPPVNTLAYSLVIDPESGYVAYPESFGAEPPWSAEELAEIVGEPRFLRDTPESMPWAGAHPWEKLENAALLAQAAKYSAQEVSAWYMMAAWSVRLDVASAGNPHEAELRELMSPMPAMPPGPTDLLTPAVLRTARWWESELTAGRLADLPLGDVEMALAWLYRSRGELADCERWLQRALLDDLTLDTAPGSLYSYLRESLELERGYLRLARQQLELAWKSGEISQTRQSSAAMLIGEICRRLGENGQALYWYGQAEETNVGLPSMQLIAHLRELASGPAAPLEE